jgi:hypothetical protein
MMEGHQRARVVGFVQNSRPTIFEFVRFQLLNLTSQGPLLLHTFALASVRRADRCHAARKHLLKGATVNVC